MADRVGRRYSILLSTVLFIATSICGAMPSFPTNVFMCWLMGVSVGGLIPVAVSLLSEVVSSCIFSRISTYLDTRVFSSRTNPDSTDSLRPSTIHQHYLSHTSSLIHNNYHEFPPNISTLSILSPPSLTTPGGPLSYQN